MICWVGDAAELLHGDWALGHRVRYLAGLCYSA